MTLRAKIEQDLTSAQKAKDKITVETLRFLLSAIKYKEVDTKELLMDEQILEVLAKQVKTHQESIEAFEKGGRDDLVTKEKEELKILQKYLPEQLGEDEVRRIISEAIKQYRDKGERVETGLVMKTVMPKLKGRADGSLVKRLVDEIIKR